MAELGAVLLPLLVLVDEAARADAVIAAHTLAVAA